MKKISKLNWVIGGERNFYEVTFSKRNKMKQCII